MVRLFETSDYPEMASWYAARKLKAPPRESLPALGFIVPGVAASFLYDVEGKMGFSEGTVTNPGATAPVRLAALMAVWDAVIAAAQERGFYRIVSSTRIPAIAEYAAAKGCTVRKGSYSIVKELKG